MNARFAQPHDNNASAAIVTTTTGLYDDLQLYPYLVSEQQQLYPYSNSEQQLYPYSNSEQQLYPYSISEQQQMYPYSISEQQRYPNSNSEQQQQQQQQAHSSPVAEAATLTPLRDSLTSTCHDIPPHNYAPPENGSTQQNDNGQENNSGEKATEALSHSDLGIITDQPSKPEFAVLSTRLASFREWPANHHMHAQDLATAGFYYTGVADCARCFWCGGGLRRWELDDNVWVEHAVWFPRCAYLKQKAGKQFVDRVQEINNKNKVVKYDEVLQSLIGSNVLPSTELLRRNIERDAAILAVKDNGLDTAEVLELAMEMYKEGQSLSSDKLFQAPRARHLSEHHGGEERMDVDPEPEDEEIIKSLRKDNDELRQNSICKICLENQIADVFLPCGHFVSCADCSFAVTTCPLCRSEIKGRVKAYIG